MNLESARRAADINRAQRGRDGREREPVGPHLVEHADAGKKHEQAAEAPGVRAGRLCEIADRARTFSE